MDGNLRTEPKIPLSPQDRIVRRLVKCGVPTEYLDKLQPGLVAFVRENKFLIPQLVCAIVPINEDLSEALHAEKEVSGGDPKCPNITEQFCESVVWLQWLMFKGEPEASLGNLAKMGVGQHGVCAAVWGNGDIAYRCCTCELDPTCAICVPCFQNGDHIGHDYSIIYTCGGCCDCGDVTAWKCEGFCSKHKGAEQIEPLPEVIANSIGPVLDAFFRCWKDKLLAVENVAFVNPRESDSSDLNLKAANKLSSAAVDMLLNFCKHTESLLAFISERMLVSVGLLDILVRAERFLHKKVVKKLHELLLKLLGEPNFKYEFAKVFIKHYPVIVGEGIKECSDSVFEKYPLLSLFSVQIFTVPTLTPRLVRESNLLAVMLGCLGDLFLSCAGEKGHLQVNKWANLYETTIRLVKDIHYVMSHAEVPKHVVHEVQDISRTWVRLLTLVQGMDPLKRVIGLHTEEGNENMIAPFFLGRSIGEIHSLLVEGAFSINEAKETRGMATFHTGIQDSDDLDSLQHAKAGRFSEDSAVCSIAGTSSLLGCSSQSTNVNVDSGVHLPIPSSATWLIFECLKAIDSSLGQIDAKTSSTLRKSLYKIQKRKNITMSYPTPSRPKTDVSEDWLREVDGNLDPCSSVHHDSARNMDVNDEFHFLIRMDANMEGEGSAEVRQTTNEMDFPDMESELANTSVDFDKRGMRAGCAMELDDLCLFRVEVWPKIVYDVGSDISFHIPLHRLLSVLLQKALKRCYGESGLPEMEKRSGSSSDFFRQVLGGCHPNGFSAFVMQHPLQLRVFCAQVHAGMWKKNGYAAILSSECYHSVQWWNQGLESDLFLLQCCAALAPPDLFVERIIERFELSNYHSLKLECTNEYEPVLVQEMLTLIIQIIKERRFCGLSTTENLRRELVYKLAIGDATHSELMRALPHDLSDNDHLQESLDELAVYSNPSGMKQGKYSLRKTYWKELDLYHPRWNSRDLQVAEERFLQFCKVSAPTVQLPRWTKIFYPLSTISRIATSKAVLKIVRTVLFYAVFTDKSSISRAPDGVLLTALHLLYLALDICYVHKQACISKYGGTVDVLHSSDMAFANNSQDLEDPFPILTYACEEIDVETNIGPVSWKHQNMIELLVSLLRKYRKENEHSFVDASQCNFSSLIEDLLKKLAELSARCMAELQRLAPNVIGCLSQDTSSSGMQNLAMTSDAEARKARVRDRQAAILEQMRAAQTKFIQSLDQTASCEIDISNSKQEVSISNDSCIPEEVAPVVCSLCREPDSRSPLSYLILLQKSRLTSFVERGPPSWEEVNPSDKKHLPPTRSETADPSGTLTISSSSETVSASHLMQLVQNDFEHGGQQAELYSSLDSIKAHVPAIKFAEVPNASYDASMDMAFSPEMTEDDIYQSIQRGIHDIIMSSNVLEVQKSSISHGEGSIKDKNTESAVLREYIASPASETSKLPPSSGIGFLRNENVPPNSAVQIGGFDCFGPIDCDGIHVSSCGHAVHQECRERYLSSHRQRSITGIDFEEGIAADPDQGVFICPVCRRLANSVLPVLPIDSNELGKQTQLSDDSLTSITGTSSASLLDNDVLHFPLALSLLQSAANVVKKSKFLKTFSLQSVETESRGADIESVYRMLCRLYFADRYDTLLASGRVSHSMLMWGTFTYSLIATEIAARGGKTSSSTEGSNSSMETLYKEVQSSTGFILCLLLQAAHITRGQSRLQVLLRFRGIELFVGTICSGVSLDGLYAGQGGKEGNMSCILQHVGKGLNFPDIDFWKRAASPILAHDPFSSLMWVLFCLPLPFLSSKEWLLPLVHLFYLVCVIQALIACVLSNQFHFSESRPGGSFINDVSKIMGESAVVRQYFISKYIDASSFPEDMIRKFTAPYLRRCALLWKLLTSSTGIRFSGSSHGLDNLNNGVRGNTAGLSLELQEVTELENLFQISSLEKIFKDKAVHALALKWCEHFCKEFGVRNHGHILPTTPAVPFKLMCLPHLYQDLIQRYVKQRCPECKSVPRLPALCLLCGRLCSMSWKPCCRKNVCQRHAMACGASIGVFLLIRRTTILLQKSARQVPWHSLYLDAFGEEDIGMLRGKPLYLNEERYATLTQMVASHGLDWSSGVFDETINDIDMLFTF